MADVIWEAEASTGFERGSGPWPSDRRFEQQRKVRWLALGQLLRTGMHVVVSRTFGQYNDRRDSFAFAPGNTSAGACFDHGDERTTSGGSPLDPYWFDFVADIGDGFNAAAAVAEQLGREQFVVADRRLLDGDDPDALPRGRLLVMGGDEVYPLPSATAERDAYRDRLAGPYECALQYLRDPKVPVALGEPERPVLHLYAIPGNHDWYDGLGAFIKQFCSGHWIGAWKTEQRRSYFAIRLPHQWWIWGIDLAFEGPMDAPQLQYFTEVAKQVVAEDGRIILCSGYPRWLEPDEEGRGPYSVLRGFLHQTLGEERTRVRLMLSGDSHFYARHTPPAGADGCVKVIAGGGGAYLSGTQALEDEVRILETRDAKGPTVYTLENEWPPRRTARGSLAWSALVRVWRHWSLSLLIAVLYLLLAAIVRVGASGGLGLRATIDVVGRGSWGDVFVRLLEGGAKSATFWIFVAILWVAMSGLALALQRGEKVKGFSFNWVWGFGHSAAHVGAALVVTTTALFAAHGLQGTTEKTLRYYAIVIAGGYVVGTFLFALYLALAQYAKRSVWALFPLVAHEGWKNFLRIRVTRDAVTVYALGLQRVPKHRTVTWDDRTGSASMSSDPAEWAIIDRVGVARDRH
jgi:hypothetical protein